MLRSLAWQALDRVSRALAPLVTIATLAARVDALEADLAALHRGAKRETPRRRPRAGYPTIDELLGRVR